MLNPRVILALLAVFLSHPVVFSDEPRLHKDPNPRVRHEEKVVAVAGGGEALDAASTPRLKELLQKRTLDVETKPGISGFAILPELASDYKKKYGEALPLYVSEDLIAVSDSKSKEASAAAAIPGTNTAAPKPLEGGGRIGGKLHAVPITVILRYYANGLDCDFEVRDGMILFTPRK